MAKVNICKFLLNVEVAYISQCYSLYAISVASFTTF